MTRLRRGGDRVRLDARRLDGVRDHGDPGWPAFDAERRLVQCFDTRPAVTAYPRSGSRRLWQDHTFPALPLIG